MMFFRLLFKNGFLVLSPHAYNILFVSISTFTFHKLKKWISSHLIDRISTKWMPLCKLVTVLPMAMEWMSMPSMNEWWTNYVHSFVIRVSIVTFMCWNSHKHTPPPPPPISTDVHDFSQKKKKKLSSSEYVQLLIFILFRLIHSNAIVFERWAFFVATKGQISCPYPNSLYK